MSQTKMVSFPKVILVLLVVIEMGHSYLVDMKRLNSQQVEAMGKLRDLMEQEKLEVQPHLWENYSLAKWLHYNDFNVEATCEAMKKNIQWRAEENMDNILKEDWSDMKQRFPYTRGTCDKEDRPIIYVDIGKWDVAGYLSQGKQAEDRFFRYLLMWAEETEAVVWEYCKAGKYVVQSAHIVNLAGFSTLKHACLSCLQVFRKASGIMEPNYPNIRHRSVAVGTPLLFRAVYWALTPTSQSHFVLFGYDRNQWESHLLESIDPDQMPSGLMELSNTGQQQQGSPTFTGLLPEQKYTNYGRIQQRSTSSVDPMYPFSFSDPATSLPGFGRLWKREL